ncbi:MAG TPA: chorismate synthase [Acidimicrobiia bacterium]|jgi:chorismate synthase|nr:chorismate synthase [Acidimicrobiia bacterium]
MLRFLTAGESHGPGLVTIVEGLPRGVEVSSDGLARQLARRRHGYGRGQRMKIEQDEIEILGGVRHGTTLGSPVAVLIRNTEWPRWERIMSPGPGEAGNEVTRPRPGHADLAGMLKYDTEDARDILERASARETAARTVVGYLASRLLEPCGVEVLSHVVAIGPVTAKPTTPMPGDLDRIDADPVRCLDPEASAAMVAAIDEAQEARDTLGGVFEVVAHGVPVGIGSHVHYDRRLDHLLGGALMSIQAIKAVEVGDGFETAMTPGSSAHDEIVRVEGMISRETNRSGGIEGGMSNGQPIRVRGAMKPISTLMQPLRTVDMSTGEADQAVRERSDVCAVPAAGVVGEQMVSFVLANEFTRKFGGDTTDELLAGLDRYRARVDERLGR